MTVLLTCWCRGQSAKDYNHTMLWKEAIVTASISNTCVHKARKPLWVIRQRRQMKDVSNSDRLGRHIEIAKGAQN